MKLQSWLAERDLTYAQMGRLLGDLATLIDGQAMQPVRHQTVRRWCLAAGNSEHRLPHASYMPLIYRLTEGRVCPNDFYELPELTGGDHARVTTNGAGVAP